jgi:MFS family permease
MQTLAAVSMVIGAAGFALLLTAEHYPESPWIVFTYCLFLGIAFGIQAIAMGNLMPDYFGRTEFPKIMGYTMPITTLVASFGATIPGIIHDMTGTYNFAFQLCFCCMILGLICIIFAKPPVHPSLKAATEQKDLSLDSKPASSINI